MWKIYFLQFFLVFVNVTIILVSGQGETVAEKCISLNSACSARQHCCPTSNGKSYCNVKSGYCEAIRYCDESLPCPFDDLSKEEITDTIAIIKQSNLFGSPLLFPVVRKQEPKKKEWNSGLTAATERIAYAVVVDADRNGLFKVLISLDRRSIISSTYSPQNVALVTNNDFDSATQILLNDKRIIKAYERRGLNMSYAAFDLWAYGAMGNTDATFNLLDLLGLLGLGATGNAGGKRLLRVVPDYQDPDTKYLDWRPLEGLEATIDVTTGKIIHFVDSGNVPVPNSPQLSSEPKPTKPIKVVQPDESSIIVNGFVINWYNWKFQYSFDPVHGLQFYHIRLIADCEERFLIYKMSLSEMFVPYGAQGETWRWRGAFDVGEYGLGKSAIPLILGQDVPDNSILLSCSQLDDTTGEVSVLEGCIALYERDCGPMYKHFDSSTGNEDGKACTEMVAVFMATIGNYDYMFEYVFSMDGNIDVGVYPTGILLQRATIPVKNDPNCIENCEDFIFENTIAPAHQHFFNYRIDFDIEGTNNLLLEADFVNEPRSLTKNPDGGAFSLRRTIIPRESFRDYSAPNARSWTVINPQSRNKFNTPRGYSLQPKNMAFTFLKDGGELDRATFISHPLWVTRYNDDEQGAAGDFPRSGISGQGLPKYIQNYESLDNFDLVAWHTIGFTHGPRPEEYPLMNSMRFGFSIISRNFQSSNSMVPLKNQCPSSSIKFM